MPFTRYKIFLGVVFMLHCVYLAFLCPPSNLNLVDQFAFTGRTNKLRPNKYHFNTKPKCQYEVIHVLSNKMTRI